MSPSELPEQLAALDELIVRFGAAEDPAAAQAVGFALLNKTALLINAERPDDAVTAAEELLSLFERQPDDRDLAGFGEMLLDASFWLLTWERNEVVVGICQAVADRLADSPGERRVAVAAGARLHAAVALSRTGRADEAPLMLEQLHAMGEPALQALDRAERRFGDAPANEAWLAQVALNRVPILLRLGRAEEARAAMDAVTARFGARDSPVAAELIDELRQAVDRAARGDESP